MPTTESFVPVLDILDNGHRWNKGAYTGLNHTDHKPTYCLLGALGEAWSGDFEIAESDTWRSDHETELRSIARLLPGNGNLHEEDRFQPDSDSLTLIVSLIAGFNDDYDTTWYQVQSILNTLILDEEFSDDGHLIAVS